jgi:hypothetical protein
MIDTVWSVMQEDEFYSPNDLANILRQPPHVVMRVLGFLEKYGFAERLTKRELIFRRLENKLGPRDALKTLRMLLGETDDAGRIANISEAPKRFRPVQ